jgi:hypothetical protein
MSRGEKKCAEQFGLIDPSSNPETIEKPRYENNPPPKHVVNQDFINSEHATQIISNPEFEKLFNDYQQMAEEVDEAGVLMPDLPKEDDAGNIEYKLRLVNLTVEKVRSRTTQMYFRLKVSTAVSNRAIGGSRYSVLHHWGARFGQDHRTPR